MLTVWAVNLLKCLKLLFHLDQNFRHVIKSETKEKERPEKANWALHAVVLFLIEICFYWLVKES